MRGRVGKRRGTGSGRTAGLASWLPDAPKSDAIPFALLILGQFKLVPIEGLRIGHLRVFIRDRAEVMERLVQGERRGVDIGQPRLGGEGRFAGRGCRGREVLWVRVWEGGDERREVEDGLGGAREGRRGEAGEGVGIVRGVWVRELRENGGGGVCPGGGLDGVEGRAGKAGGARRVAERAGARSLESTKRGMHVSTTEEDWRACRSE